MHNSFISILDELIEHKPCFRTVDGEVSAEVSDEITTDA
jgi:hypothetical protein